MYTRRDRKDGQDSLWKGQHWDSKVEADIETHEGAESELSQFVYALYVSCQDELAFREAGLVYTGSTLPKYLSQ